MRRLLRPALTLAMIAGLVLAVWPLGQYTYATWNQRELSSQWQTAARKGRTHQKTPPQTVPISKKATAPKTSRSPMQHDSDSPTLASVSPASALRAAWPVTKLSIPDIGLETYVVQGMDAPALRRGPGHDVNSSPPGAGNCVIAGHRNVYGSYFYRLDELSPGAPIRLENSDGVFEYVADVIYVTPDTNLTVVQPPPTGTAPLLTLITCTLPHTNNRLIVRAHLEQPESG